MDDGCSSRRKLHGCTVSIKIEGGEGMIVSFADSATADLFAGKLGKPHYPVHLIRRSMKTLDILNAATRLADLAAMRGNRLEPLRGDLEGLHSIRINDQWRLVFRWTGDGAADVRIQDYHP